MVGLQRGYVVIPKSVTPERIEENARVFDFTLNEGAMGELDALDRTGGTDRARENRWWSLRARVRGGLAAIAGRGS